jgi:hypothetical protein
MSHLLQDRCLVTLDAAAEQINPETFNPSMNIRGKLSLWHSCVIGIKGIIRLR